MNSRVLVDRCQVPLRGGSSAHITFPEFLTFPAGASDLSILPNVEPSVLCCEEVPVVAGRFLSAFPTQLQVPRHQFGGGLRVGVLRQDAQRLPAYGGSQTEVRGEGFATFFQQPPYRSDVPHPSIDESHVEPGLSSVVDTADPDPTTIRVDFVRLAESDLRWSSSGSVSFGCHRTGG